MMKYGNYDIDITLMLNSLRLSTSSHVTGSLTDASTCYAVISTDTESDVCIEEKLGVNSMTPVSESDSTKNVDTVSIRKSVSTNDGRGDHDIP